MKQHVPRLVATVLSAAPALALAFATSRVRADSPSTTTSTNSSSTEEADVSQVGLQLRLFAELARTTRLTIAATGLLTGAALVPAGVVLARRADEVSRSIGVGMVAGGAAPLLFSVLMLRGPSAMESLSSNFETRLASGMTSAELLRATDREWADAANAGHDRRIVIGISEVALGGASTAAGLFLLLAKSGFAGLSRNSQYEVGSFLLGPGLPILTLGIRSLYVETPEETSWALHVGTTDPARHAAAVAQITPTQGGMVAGMVIEF